MTDIVRPPHPETRPYVGSYRNPSTGEKTWGVYVAIGYDVLDQIVFRRVSEHRTKKQAYRAMESGPDSFTWSHLAAWLLDTVHKDDQMTVLRRICALLADHPDLVETRSWPEMRELADRNYPDVQ